MRRSLHNAAGDRGALLTVATALQARTADIVFVVFLATIAYFRWQIIASSPVPPGLDGGNWLALGHSILGSHSRSSSILYPPVVPVLSIVLAVVWGPLKGTEILAVLSTLAPAAGTYVLLRGPLGIRAALLAGLLAPAATTGEAASWGGYPQLLGLGLLPLVPWALEHFLTTQSLRWAAASSAVIFAALATSDLIGPVAVAVAIVYMGLRILMMERSARPSRSLLEFGLLMAPSLALLPIYLALLGGVLLNEATKTSSQHVTLANFQPTLDNYLKENLEFWHFVLFLALLSPIILVIRRRHPLATAATAVFAPAIAFIVTLREIRFVFVLPVAIAIGLGAWWTVTSNSTRSVASAFDRVLVATVALVLVVESALGIATFKQQVQWYTSLTPSTVSALEDLDKLAPRGAVLAVSAAAAHEDGWPLGRWVEGLLDRPTYYASDLEWLNYPDERRRARIANEIFSPSEGVSGAITIARANGINYIIVATGWPGYRQWVSSSPSIDGATVVIQNDSMLILATSG